jgi:hypothetical protein
MNEREAECSCGQLKVAVSGEPVRISICHCLACQRRTGSAFGVQARYPRERVRISGESRTYTRVSDAGEERTFNFCPQCGATMYFATSSAPDVVGIPMGAFADPEFPAPKFSVWERRKHRWVTAPPGVERHS